MRHSYSPKLTFEPSDRPKLADRPFRLVIGSAIVRMSEAEVESLKDDCRAALQESDQNKEVK